MWPLYDDSLIAGDRSIDDGGQFCYDELSNTYRFTVIAISSI